MAEIALKVPQKRGRPVTLPDGTRNRTLRLTDVEYETIKRILNGLRAKTPAKQGGK